MALFLAQKGDRELDEDGEKVRKEEYKKTKPEIMENEGEGQTEKPIAGANQFLFREEVKKVIYTRENTDTSEKAEDIDFGTRNVFKDEKNDTQSK